MQTYLDKIDNAIDLINHAEKIVIGIGAGMSAAGGLCYTDPELAQKWYPEYFSLGKKSIIEIMSEFWPTSLNENNATKFWGFWAKHIFHIRYEPDALQPYLDLFNIVKGKDYFICTTNVDSQTEKAGFDAFRTSAMQGNYCFFQCSTPCTQEIFHNEIIIEQMIHNMITPFEIKKTDIPVCPHCGALLVPNLRCDNRFVESPNLANLSKYEEYVTNCRNKTSIFLELGVGYNTPGIIRYPFEKMVHSMPKSHLIRVNNMNTEIHLPLGEKNISVQVDLMKFMADLAIHYC